MPYQALSVSPITAVMAARRRRVLCPLIQPNPSAISPRIVDRRPCGLSPSPAMGEGPGGLSPSPFTEEGRGGAVDCDGRRPDAPPAETARAAAVAKGRKEATVNRIEPAAGPTNAYPAVRVAVIRPLAESSWSSRTIAGRIDWAALS